MSDINKYLLLLFIMIMVVVVLGSLCSDGNAQSIFNKDGKPYAKRQGRTQEPKIIVDTVSIVSGWGSLKLRSSYSSTQHRTTPTDKYNFHCFITPQLADSTDSVYYYGYIYIEAENRALIKSSGGAADTGKVEVFTVLK